MTERDWFRMRQPGSLWAAVWEKRTTRQERLFSCACCRRLGDLITDEQIRGAIDVSERFADGQATKNELNRVNRRVLRALQAISRDETAAVTADPHWQALAAIHAATATGSDTVRGASSRVSRAFWSIRHGLLKVEEAAHADILRDIFGNPFRPVAFDPSWRTGTTVSLACQMYEAREFGAMPILADALQDTGCEDEAILAHCRDVNQVHVRGCWVVDLVLGKE